MFGHPVCCVENDQACNLCDYNRSTASALAAVPQHLPARRASKGSGYQKWDNLEFPFFSQHRELSAVSTHKSGPFSSVTSLQKPLTAVAPHISSIPAGTTSVVVRRQQPQRKHRRATLLASLCVGVFWFVVRPRLCCCGVPASMHTPGTRRVIGVRVH